MFRPCGPICFERQNWWEVDDGTLCRYFSPCPGVIGQGGDPADTDVNAPKILTARDILQIAPTAGDNAAAIASALNRATTEAGIKTRIGQAMLIAQCAHESGGFAGDVFVEQFVESSVVFNAGANIDAKFKVKAPQTRRMERYLHGHQLVAWRQSKARFIKAKAEYEKTSAGKKFEDLTAEKAWKPLTLTDYLPGDQELPYWKLWYDPSSPHVERSRNARANGNVDPGDGLKFIGRGFIQLTWRSNYEAADGVLKLGLVANPDSAADLENAIRIVAWFWKSRSLNSYTNQDTTANFTKLTTKINHARDQLENRLKYYQKAKTVLGVVAKPAGQKSSPAVPATPGRLP